MTLPLNFLIEALGLFLAAKLLNVNLNVITAPVVILLATLVAHLMPGLLGLLIALVVYIGAIKVFDRSADFLKIVGLFVIGIAVQKVLLEQVINPMIS